MGPAQNLPVFDEKDRALFDEEDPRRRADSLRDHLVPKLRPIHRHALDRIREVYGCDPHEGSSPSVSPEHRKGARATKEFHAAYAGLVGRQVGGKYISPRLIHLLSGEGLGVVFWINKAREADVLDRVLRRHPRPIRSLLEFVDSPAVWAGPDGRAIARSPALNGLSRVRIPALDRFRHVGLCGGLHDYPIETKSVVGRLTTDFMALYPIYRAVVDELQGQDDPFPALFERFEAWSPGDDDQPGGIEGAAILAYRQHRKREKKLRAEKIRQALARCGGRLRCEVPGCGFDFYEVYGEIGREFAHVHHLEPLGERDRASNTSLDDLAIVCANCHAMIHRGGVSRPLVGLIRRAGSSEAKPAAP